MKKSFADILSGIDERRDKKIAAKLPEWAAAGSLQIPSSLALEQCSSTATALYKAEILRREIDGIPGPVVCDITGGLGVDSWAFSRVAGKVFYYERNAELAAAVASNYEILRINNVVINNESVDAATGLPCCDLIFADPARRSDTGNKVFLLEDCTPDILQLLPRFRQHCSTILLKLSPMADISMLSKRLGPECSEIHTVGLDGECKEVLCLIKKDFTGPCLITVASLDTGGRLSFHPEEEREAVPRYKSPTPGDILFEPSAALMKAGCFRLICSRFGIDKLSPSTNLYTTGEVPADLAALGKSYKVLEVLPFSNASIKDAGRRYPRAEVTARGIPLSSDELRKKMGVRSGSDAHIFGCTATDSRILVICQAAR